MFYHDRNNEWKSLHLTLAIIKGKCLARSKYSWNIKWINLPVGQQMLLINEVCVVKSCLCCPPVAQWLNSERLLFPDHYLRGVWMFRFGSLAVFLGSFASVLWDNHLGASRLKPQDQIRDLLLFTEGLTLAVVTDVINM